MMPHRNWLSDDLDRPGVHYFGGTRMAMLDVEGGFWQLRRQIEALAGRRLSDEVLRQAGVDGGTSFAGSFLADAHTSDRAQSFRECLAAFQAAGFGEFRVMQDVWPNGPITVQARDTFEVWAEKRRDQPSAIPTCAYTAGVLLGFAKAVTRSSELICLETACQALGDDECRFELRTEKTVEGRPVSATDPVLGQQLNLLEILFERTPLGIAIFDRELRLRRWNDTWEAFVTKYSPAAHGQLSPGVALQEIVPYMSDDFKDLVSGALAGKSVRLESLKAHRPDSISYWDVILVPLMDRGECVGFVEATLDATDRITALETMERTVERLREREERFSLVMRGTNDGIWDWDLRTNQVYFSPRWKSMLGHEEGEIPNELHEWSSRIHPDDLDRAMAVLQEHLHGQTEFYSLEHRLQHKDGDYRWILARGVSLRDARGKPYRIAGSHTDITVRKQAEEELQHLADFEKMITSISTNFINLSPEEMDNGIAQALRNLGEFAGVDRSYVFIFSENETRMRNTHEWCAPGIESHFDSLQDVPASLFPWTNEILLSGETLHVSDLFALPDGAASDKAQFIKQGIRSLLAVPMTYRGSVLGFLGFDSVRSEKVWSQDSIQLLRTVGEIFVNALEHKRSQAIQAGQRQFLELLARGGSLEDTLLSLARLLEEQWPRMLALVLRLDEEGKRLHHAASISLPQEYLDSIEGLEIGPEVGSCGTACYYVQRVIVENIEVDPRWDGLRQIAQQHELRACWSEPVLSSTGELLGTFAMYYRYPRAPAEGELRAIQMAAHLAGIAMEHEQVLHDLQSARDELELRVEERTAELQRANQRLQQEIVQRERADDALRQSEARYRDLVENANSIILQMNSQGTITFFNRYAQEFFGYSEEEILGRSVLDTIVPETDSLGNDMYAHLQAVLRSPESHSSRENENIRRNGERVWVAWNNKAVRGEDGELQEVLCIGIDRTEQKRAQDILAHQAEEKAVAAERSRLARDLHDAVTQTLFSTSLIAEVLPRLWERDPEAGRQRLSEIRQLTRGALAEMRTLLMELRPAALVESELEDLLKQLAEATMGRARVKVDVVTEGECDVPVEVKVALYRVAQEALNNVAKHAGAYHASVHLCCQDGQVDLRVTDDGRGFDMDSVPPDHMGLSIMRERSETIGADLRIVSRPAAGTRVCVLWIDGKVGDMHAVDKPSDETEDKTEGLG